MANRLVFLEVPESLRARFAALLHEHSPGEEDHHHHHGGEGFVLDPAIPLPVELCGEEESGDETPGRPDLEQLSWEMILAGMIRVLTEDGEGEHANYYRRLILTLRPKILRDLTGAAIAKAEKGDHGMALEILAGLEGIFPGSPVVLLNRVLILEKRAEERAEALERSGREEEAAELHAGVRDAWEELLARRPLPPEVLFNAGLFFMRRRDFERARECFARYLPRAEDDEKKDKARALLAEIRQGSLEDESFRRAYDLIQAGEEEDGLLRARDFLERHPGVWNGWFILGWGLRRLGRWADGAASFHKALEMGGDNPDTRNELAICLSELGDLKAARRELEAALREEPENIKIISNLGALALKSGDRAEAEGFFRTVLELDPEDPVAQGFLA